MASLLLKNIASLVGTHADNLPLRGKRLANLPSISNAWLYIEDGIITAFGHMDTLDDEWLEPGEELDLSGQYVLPGWCDSHTHLVFAATREEEFVDKIRGASYAEIAAKGGGILNSATKIAEASERDLLRGAMNRLQELMRLGTVAVEIKSGYGLSVEGELKMLRVIKRLKEMSPIPIKATFLGAHTYPVAYRDDHRGYIDLIVREMLPVIAEEGLADYIDVFCEQGFFSPSETEEICEAGKRIGLRPKIHANQLSLSGGVEAGIRTGALSVDHLETMSNQTIEALAGSEVIGTLLPGAAFFLRMPFQPARALIDAGAIVSLASDLNPGSCPSGNMNLVVALACIQMRMLPQEAINAATLNAAHAMEVADELGSIAKGKLANLIITKPVPSLAYLPYSFGTNLIDQVLIRGERV